MKPKKINRFCHCSALVDNTKLGEVKLEGILTKYIALGTKVYGGVNESGQPFVKAKGY